MITESVQSILARQEINQDAAAGSSFNIVDKDGFFKLLIAQMKHQDPFEPMESSEMMSQMAQFSTLEQLQNINANMTSSLQWDLLFNQTVNNTMATSLIGREIEATGQEIVLTSSGTTSMRFDLGEFSSEVTIEVLDADGGVVFSDIKRDMDSGTHDWVWNGEDADGNRLGAGVYSVKFTAKNLAGDAVSVDSFRMGIVESIEYDAGQAFLIVNGQRIPLGDVKRVSVGNG